MGKRTLLTSLFFAVLACNALANTAPARGQIHLDGKAVGTLQDAFDQARIGSIIRLGPGVFRQAGTLSQDNVTLAGSRGTILSETHVQGKGALVIKGRNTTIRQIECMGIEVADGNGACVRLEGRNLNLEDVYFHDSQQGLLTGQEPGLVVIDSSRFERLGHVGQAHAIYVGGGTLLISQSEFLSSRSEGHEIKSRARETRIIGSVIASLEGHDSRLVDIPNGGVLDIRDSILQQGQKTSNWNLIGYALEGYQFDDNRISLEGNLFLLDRKPSSMVLHVKENKVRPHLRANAFVGLLTDSFDDSNYFFDTREKAGIQAYPFLPPPTAN